MKRLILSVYLLLPIAAMANQDACNNVAKMGAKIMQMHQYGESFEDLNNFVKTMPRDEAGYVMEVIREAKETPVVDDANKEGVVNAFSKSMYVQCASK